MPPSPSFHALPCQYPDHRPHGRHPQLAAVFPSRVGCLMHIMHSRDYAYPISGAPLPGQATELIFGLSRLPAQVTPATRF